MADSVNAFTVYSSLELQINEFVQQLNRASQMLDSTLQNMSGAVTSLDIQPIEVNTEIIPPDISTYEIPSEILDPDRPEMPVATPFSVPSEIENPDLPVFPEEQTYILHTETEPLEPVTVPPADDRNFIQKIKDSFNNLKNTISSIPTNIALKFTEMGKNIINTFKSFPSNVSAKFSEMKNIAVDKIKGLPASVAGVITSIPSKIGSGLKTIGTNVSNAFKSGVDSAKNALKELPEKASEALKETGEKLKSIAETVAKSATVAISAASAGIVAFGKSAVETGANFDKSMSQVAATMGKSVNEIADLREFAQEMGRTTAFSATDSADALNYMALAGYDAETSMAMLPNVLNLASAGGMELALASDMITDSQSALGLSLDETTQLVDKMAKASSKSNTSVSQLGDAILTVGGTAKKLKGGTTELATVLGILADNGIKGSEGGTALRNIMNSLISPTEDATAMLESMGTSLYDEAGNMRSLNDVFIDLRNGMDGLATQAEKDQVLTTIFNARDLKSAEALIANVGDRFNELSTEINNSANAADAMAKTQLDNLAGDVTLFQSALEGAKIAVSDQLTPALRDFVKMGSDAMSEISYAFESSDDLETAVFKMGRYLQGDIYKFVSKIVDVIPLVVSIATTLIKSIGQAIVKNIPKLANSAIELLKGFADGITKNAPTAIKGFSDMLKKVSEWIKQNGKIFISSGMEMIKSIAKGISDNLLFMLNSIKEIIYFIADTISQNLPLLLDSALSIIGAIGQGIVNNLPLLIDSALEIIKTLAAYLGENLSEIIPAVIDVILQIVETLTDPHTLSGLVDAALAIIIGLADGLINSLPVLLERLPQIVQNIVDVIVDNVPKLIDAAIEIIAKLGEYLTDPKNLVAILDAGLEMIVTLIDGAKRVFWKLGKMAEDMIQAIADTLGLGEYREWGMDMIDNILDGAREKLDEWNNFWEDVGMAVYDFLHHSTPEKGPLKDDDKWGGDLMDNLINGVKSEENELTDTVEDVARNIGKAFENPITFNAEINTDENFDGLKLTDISSTDFMEKLINGIKSKEKTLSETLKDVVENIRKTFEKPVSVNADVTTDENFNWLKLPDISGADFMENLIDGVKSKEKTLADTVRGVAESIRETFEEPISVNTDITANGSFNRLKVPDISTVAENIYTVKSDNTQSYQTEKESPVTVENLNITLDSGFKISSDYDTEKFINMVAERLQARQTRITRGTGGVIF